MSGNLLLAAAIFVVSVVVAIGLSLFVITVVLRMQARHRKRLARVGRKRMSGRLDLDDMRMTLLRQKQETNVLVTVTEYPTEGDRDAARRADVENSPPRRLRGPPRGAFFRALTLPRPHATRGPTGATRRGHCLLVLRSHELVAQQTVKCQVARRKSPR